MPAPDPDILEGLYYVVLNRVRAALEEAGLADNNMATASAVAFQGLVMCRSLGLSQKDALFMVQTVYSIPRDES